MLWNQSCGMIMNISSKILSKLYSKPYLLWTNTATGVLSISIGDIIQQNLEHRWHVDVPRTKDDKFEWDPTRTKNMMLAGVYFSMFGHWWYSWLDRKFPPKIHGSVKKKLLAESLAGPLIVSSVFFLVGAVHGQTLDKCWHNIRSNFGLICTAEWATFVPLQWVNFRFVPSKYRYLYVATVSIGYDAFLSYVLNRNERYRQMELHRQQSKLNTLYGVDHRTKHLETS